MVFRALLPQCRVWSNWPLENTEDEVLMKFDGHFELDVERKYELDLVWRRKKNTVHGNHAHFVQKGSSLIYPFPSAVCVLWKVLGLSLFIQTLNICSSFGEKVSIWTVITFLNPKFTVYKGNRLFEVVCHMIQQRWLWNVTFTLSNALKKYQ